VRYYKIEVEGWKTFTSLSGGKTDPGALQVDLDISVNSADVVTNGSSVRIWGLGLEAISQTANLFNKNVTISAGFAPGLPLATLASKYAGKLGNGTIYQVFGNWIGTDQTLDLVFVPGSNPPVAGGPNPKPPTKNLTLDWKKDQPLKTALESCLKQAYPDVKVAIDISSRIVARQNQPGFFSSLNQLSQYCRRISQDILGGQAVGVSIVNNSGELRVFDDTAKSTTKKINFADLIGQPTWIKPATVQFKTVMRGDLKPGDVVTLPKTFFNSSYSAAVQGSSAATGQLGFSGSFTVAALRHVGSYRQPTAEAWVTIVEAFTAGTGSQADQFSYHW
jgi:hypothetical protein